VGKRNLESPLLGLQSFMIDAVRLLSPIAESEGVASRVEQLVTPGARGLTAAERLDVYREQFWLRHLPNLRDDYPTLAWAVGGDAFERLSIEFLRTFPPRTWDLRRLGADLPAHVASRAPWDEDAMACGAARLDWAFMESNAANDASPLDPRLLLASPESAWPSARVGLHPSVRRLVIGHPLHRVRSALKHGDTPERPSPESTYIVVCRDEQSLPRATAIDSFAFALLDELERGVPLGEACENVVRAEMSLANGAAIGDRVAACFQQWTASGWVSSVAFDA